MDRRHFRLQREGSENKARQRHLEAYRLFFSHGLASHGWKFCLTQQGPSPGVYRRGSQQRRFKSPWKLMVSKKTRGALLQGLIRHIASVGQVCDLVLASTRTPPLPGSKRELGWCSWKLFNSPPFLWLMHDATGACNSHSPPRTGALAMNAVLNTPLKRS